MVTTIDDALALVREICLGGVAQLVGIEVA